MAKVNLTATEIFNTVSGSFIEKKINLSGVQTSDTFLIPQNKIEGIVIQYTGSPILYFTAYPNEVIEDDSALYEAWDGSSEISDLVTGFYAVNSSGDSEIMVRIRILSND